MKEQSYILQDCNSFELRDIFECGQCFRWNKELDGSYTGVVRRNVINVKKEENKILFQGIGEDELETTIKEYFDLERDYSEIKEKLSKVDENMKMGVEYGKGIRILNQDLWETIMSFIISANNNIPRIKGIIERIAKQYGDKIVWKDKEYSTFPTPMQLKNVKVEEYRGLGAGFRDIRLYETTQRIVSREVDIDTLKKEASTEKIREKLLTLSGVGPKVVDCILLFSTLKRLEVFPIDVWVRRVMNELYIQKEQENAVSRKQIEEMAKLKFGNLAGIAQQYLFYWKREA